MHRNSVQCALSHRYLQHSLEQYGMYILESNYFSKIIEGKMLLNVGTYSLEAVVALVIACRFVSD